MVYISFTVAKKDRSVWKPGKNKDTLSPQSELDYAQFDQITRRRGTLLQESYLCVFDCVWTDNISTGRAFILRLGLQHHRTPLTFSFLFFFLAPGCISVAARFLPHLRRVIVYAAGDVVRG